MSQSDLISIGSLSVSLLAVGYAYFSNTKKYELTSLYRSEVMAWFEETIKILLDLKHQCIARFPDETLKINLLSSLSAKIEVGRFYFPNIIKGDGFGIDKPLAYQGYRNLTLDFLVFSYRLYKKKDSWNFIDHAETLQRYFTSYVYELVDPLKAIKETESNTDKIFYRDLSFEDFLHIEPELIRAYITDEV